MTPDSPPPDWHGKMLECDRCVKLERHDRLMIVLDVTYILLFVGGLFGMLIFWR